MGPVGILFGVIGLALAAFSSGADDAEQSLDSLGQAVAQTNRELVATELESRGLLKEFEALGISATDVVDALLAGDAGMASLRVRLQQLVEGGTEVTRSWEEWSGGVDRTTKTALTPQAEAAQRLIGVLAELGPEVDEATAAEQRIQEAVAGATGIIGLQAEELEALKEAWASGVDEFGDSVGTYEELLEAAEEKERERAEAVAEATKSSKDSWEDYVESVSVSIDELIAKQEEQIAAMENWATNMATLAAEGIDAGLIAELAEAGPKSAALVQALVDAPANKREEYVENWRKTSAEGGAALVDELLAVSGPLARIATRQGATVARNIANAIASGKKLTTTQALAIMDSVESIVERRKLLALIKSKMDSASYARVEAALSTLARNRAMVIRASYVTTGRNPMGGPEHGGVVGAGYGPGYGSHGQEGGPRGGTDVLVGEARPEVLELPFGTRVIPSVDQAMDRGQRGGGGGVTVHIYVQGSIRSDKELVGLVRNEFLHGGLRDLFPALQIGGGTP
jgi:hypothetical protein